MSRLVRTRPVSIRFAELVIRWGGCCERCSESARLQFCHVRNTPLHGRGRGSWKRYYDIVHHPECYLMLCADCHKLLDRGLVLVHVPEIIHEY